MLARFFHEALRRGPPLLVRLCVCSTEKRTVPQAEDGVATAETDLNISVVQIYRALGGRWDLSNDSTT